MRRACFTTLTLTRTTAWLRKHLKMTLSGILARFSGLALGHDEECIQSADVDNLVYAAMEIEMIASLMAILFGGPTTDGFDWT